ncbi:hypothetical protein B0J17DRAFT_294621 [Rhizoctonia solani]|nr:hypothetical protein B0J17DRAFT_294621 [Rhizoctonia solani]
MSSDYTIVVQGDPFLLSEAQLLFDSPNLFTKYFLGETPASEPRNLRFSRNPQLFSLIHEHLCGYTILPIHENALPARMSREAALKNLRADAVYYGLKELVKLIDASSQTSAASNVEQDSFKEFDLH